MKQVYILDVFLFEFLRVQMQAFNLSHEVKINFTCIKYKFKASVENIHVIIIIFKEGFSEVYQQNILTYLLETIIYQKIIL